VPDVHVCFSFFWGQEGDGEVGIKGHGGGCGLRVAGCVFVRIRCSLCRGSSVCLEDIFDVLDDSFLCLMNVG
jgi:hypothetical protein